MTKYQVTPTGNERTFGDDEIIVSKTDTKGKITYANRVFMRVADFNEDELLGQPHSIVRHPDMPRCVFKLLWDTIESKHEIFAFVLNMAKGGDHYWVFAHVTPSFDNAGRLTGYHSSRRSPRPAKLAPVKDLYRALLEEEQNHSDRKAGMDAGVQMLTNLLSEKGVDYDEFIFSL